MSEGLINSTNKESIFGIDFLTDKVMHNLDVEKDTAEKLVYLARERSNENCQSLSTEIEKLDDEDVMDVRKQQIDFS